MDWIRATMAWLEAGLHQLTDPRWLSHNPGWAALLGLGLVGLLGWLFLFRGGKNY
jgi:LPXTG-motif cell wall-anchored protein